MIKRKADTVLKVAEPAQLMDFLIAKMGGMARSSVKQLLGQRRVKVGNAIQTRHDFALKAGDVVTVSSGRGNSQLNHPKLKIVYEDDDLIVVNKQPGLLTVAATPGSSETTAYSILRAYVKRQNARAGIFVVHRLDRETSGLLVFARSQELQHYMREYWRELVTERTYIALAEGVLEPREGKITTWLTEDKRNAVVYSSPVDDGGDIAITNYKVLRTTPPQPSPQGREREGSYVSYGFSLEFSTQDIECLLTAENDYLTIADSFYSFHISVGILDSLARSSSTEVINTEIRRRIQTIIASTTTGHRER